MWIEGLLLLKLIVKLRPRRSVYLWINIFLLLAPLYSSAQMSQHLFESLPDSLKPVNRHILEPEEVQKILRNSFKISGWTRTEYDETDSLCLRSFSKYVLHAQEPQKQAFLHLICTYLYHAKNVQRSKTSLRGAGQIYEYPYLSRALAYCDLYLKLYQHSEDPGTLSQIEAFKYSFYIEKESYKDAHHTLQKALVLAKKSQRNRYIVPKYTSFAHLYEVIDLPEKTLLYCDTASILVQRTDPSEWKQGIEAYIVRLKQIANFSLYNKTSLPEYAAKVLSLHQTAKAQVDGSWNGRLLAYSYVLVSGIRYFEQDYKGALANIDSAYHVFPNLKVIDGWEMAMVFKGLSLRKLGQITDSDSILGQLNLTDTRRPVIRLVLEARHQEELRKGNHERAQYYLEQLFHFQDRRHTLDMEGKALEMEHLYNLKQRDQKISQLTALHKQNKIIAIFIVTIIFLIVIILISLYRDTLAKSARLLLELDHAEQHMVLQMEAARMDERKILGQDLHDGLTANIAGIRHHLELVILDCEDVLLKTKLHSIYNLVQEMYQISREKSHAWFKGENGIYEQTFALQIQLLLDRALPDTHYKKEVSISNGTLIHVSTEVKINMLNIIKEALTNIVKHAHAKKVYILIYIQSDEVVLNIIDDGRGFDTAIVFNKKMGIGFQSIENRVQYLNGNWKINSDRDGTAMIIHIPL
jgi:signal transduction histidine kinase